MIDPSTAAAHAGLVVLPFASVQRVQVRCPHCGRADTRLAAAVKKGMRATCAQCRKRFVVEEIVPVIGSSGGRSGRAR